MSDRAEGSETPPAPAAPEQETPPPLAEEPADDGGFESQRPRLLPVWILLAAAAVAGGAWAVTERVGGDGPPPGEAAVPLITASAEPWKVRPDDPGGMEIPNQGTLIYETLTTADPEEGPERVLPPPEEPLSPPPPEEPVAEEPTAPEDAPIEVATLPEPGAAEPADAEQAPLVEAAPPEAAADADVPAAEPETFAVALDGVPLPPAKPGTAAPAPVAEAPQAGDDALEMTLVQDPPAPEPEAPAAAPLVDGVEGVPTPVFKPVAAARAAPAAPAAPSSEAATSLPEAELEEPQPAVGDWRYVQLAASNARRPLEAHWEMLRRRHDDVLVGLSPLIMPVDSGENGITYRLRAGPLSDGESARWVCAQLKARGLDCFVPLD